MKKFQMVSILLLGFFLIIPFANAQKVETVNGVRIIHNEKEGKWGNNPEIKLELIRTIGGLDAEDENLAFNAPYDIVLDATGNMYILDTGNKRIQKLNPEGKFIKTIGRQGQGPGEFQSPHSLDIDKEDNIYVHDPRAMRIQVLTSDGKMKRLIKFTKFSEGQIRLTRSELIVMGGRIGLRDLMQNKKPKLLEIVNQDGNIKKRFGEMRDYKDLNVNSRANNFYLDSDADGNIYISFIYQNRIEKYSHDGMRLWNADRILNYGTKVIDKGFIHRDAKSTSFQAPKMNKVSSGISVDGRGRIWVITLNRQMSLKEMGYVTSSGGVSKTIEPGIEEIDAYKLEVFDSGGILLGEIPLDHQAHGVRIYGNYLFIWERNFTKYYQYEIVDK